MCLESASFGPAMLSKVARGLPDEVPNDTEQEDEENEAIEDTLDTENHDVNDSVPSDANDEDQKQETLEEKRVTAMMTLIMKLLVTTLRRKISFRLLLNILEDLLS